MELQLGTEVWRLSQLGTEVVGLSNLCTEDSHFTYFTHSL